MKYFYEENQHYFDFNFGTGTKKKIWKFIRKKIIFFIKYYNKESKKFFIIFEIGCK